MFSVSKGNYSSLFDCENKANNGHSIEHDQLKNMWDYNELGGGYRME